MPASPAQQIVWEAQVKGLATGIAADPFADIERAVMQAFKAVPKRGAEVGGLLFGRIDVSGGDLKVSVLRTALVSCEYRFGPSFRLSDSDRIRLEEQLRTSSEDLVGFFRSSTRAAFEPGEGDLALLRDCMASARVFLLLKPVRVGEIVSRVFTVNAGRIVQASAAEVPFRSAGGAAVQDCAQRPETRRIPDNPGGAVLQDCARPPGPALPPNGHRTQARKPAFWRHAAAVAGLCAIGIVSYSAGRLYRGSPAPPTSLSAPLQLGLTASRAGGELRISWDPGHPEIASAKKADLIITDDGHEIELPLTPGDRRRGSATYHPRSDEIGIELRLIDGGRRASEYTRVVLPPTPGAGADRADSTPGP